MLYRFGIILGNFLGVVKYYQNAHGRKYCCHDKHKCIIQEKLEI